MPNKEFLNDLRVGLDLKFSVSLFQIYKNLELFSVFSLGSEDSKQTCPGPSERSGRFIKKQQIRNIFLKFLNFKIICLTSRNPVGRSDNWSDVVLTLV